MPSAVFKAAANSDPVLGTLRGCAAFPVERRKNWTAKVPPEQDHAPP